jgi:adenylate cyclase
MDLQPLLDQTGQSQPRWLDPLGGVAPHMVAALLAAFLLATPFVADLEQRVGLQCLFFLRGARPAPDAVAVVAIDGQAAQRLGQSLKPGDWPRSIHARLIDGLAGAGAWVIVFDLTFATPSKLPEDDAQLAAAMRRAGNVVLLDVLRRESSASRTEGTVANHPISLDLAVPPIPAFAQAALAHAPFPLPKQGRVDAFWTFIETAGNLPSMPVVALQAFARDELDFLLQRIGVDPPARSADVDDKLFGAMLQLRTALSGKPESSVGTLFAVSSSVDKGQSEIFGNLVGIYAGADARYLDFYGPPRTITTLSYADALDAAGAATLAGKAVFVGFSGASAAEQDRVRDHYPTVFSRDDGVDLSGVEIAATAFANLLEQRAVHPPPLGLQLALVAVFGSALGQLVYLTDFVYALPQRIAYAALFVAGLAYMALAHLAFASSALWFPLVLPLGLQMPLAAIVGTWQRYRFERRRNQALRRVLERLLPPDLAERFIAQLVSTGAVSWPIHGACLASDMEGYTGLAESLGPRALAERLNSYFARLFEPVERHGGFVSDVVGDAMVAIWGASENSAGIRRSACLAALEIAALDSGGSPSAMPGPARRTRIGLNAGEMQLAAVGASRHIEFRAVGDTVNAASRIEGLSKLLGTRLLVAEPVIAGLDEFLVRPVGNFVLVGKSEALRVVELIAPRPAASAAALALCRQFAHALQIYESGAWCEAAPLFEGILRHAPDDGPARFFAQRCARHAVDLRCHPWTPAIRMSEK